MKFIRLYEDFGMITASNITEKGIFGSNGKIVDYDINSIRIEISNKWYK